MTSPQTAQGGFRQRSLGTLTVLGWAGPYGDGQDMAFLLVYSLGDGADGPAGTAAAMHTLAEEVGLPVGTEAVDVATAGRRFPLTLIVEGGQAALTMPKLTVQYPAPPEWVAAARERGQVYLMMATTPWPQAASGTAIGEQALREFVSEEMMASAAHCLLPVRGLSR